MKLWIDTADQQAQSLFSLPPIERLRRSARKFIADTPVILSGPDATPQVWPGASTDANASKLGVRLRKALAQGAVVAVDGGNVIDPRLIGFLKSRTASCAAERGEGEQRAVALSLQSDLVDAIPPEADSLCQVADALIAAGRISRVDEQEFPAFMDKLRRSIPYWIFAVNDVAERRRLERQMFWDNYKGSTDLLTRYVYPPLVWPLVQLCTRWGIHPNAVTILSIVLTFAAVPLFANGDFLAGFICAYAMSVLDSVDGKVARLTLTDSKIGNVLDHGLDIVHPPFWYFAFAWGLGARSFDNPLYQAAVWLIVFYVADRIVLGIAKYRLGFGLHAATRLDGTVRSFIARRNITMTIMAVGVLLGFGAAGLYVITAWQGITCAWHSVRTLWLGFLVRERVQPVA